jgi:hypothetical protein
MPICTSSRFRETNTSITMAATRIATGHLNH